MKRASAVFIFVILCAATILRADEPPSAQLDFVRKLRAKGYADLALEQIEKLKKTHPNLVQVLGVEAARANVTLAKEKDPDQRQALYNAARTALEGFVAKATGPEAAQGRLELANLAALQGQAILSKALRMEDLKLQQNSARKAEAQFIAAGQQLDAASKMLLQAAKDYKNPNAELEDSTRKQLQQDALQARMDRAINYIDQARTYVDLSDEMVNRKRAELVLEARKVFEKIATEEDSKNSLTLLAKAWLVKCYQEGQEPLVASKYYKQVMGEGGKAAQAAQRWARLFYMQGHLDDPTIKTAKIVRLRNIQKDGLEWLRDYPSHKNSPEGQAVRYEVAKAFFSEAQTVSPKDPKALEAVRLYGLSQQHLSVLAETDGDFTEKAGQLSIEISFMRMGEKTPLEKMKDFDECFLKAQFELSQARQVAAALDGASGGAVEKLQAKRQEHLKESVKALTRAIELSNPKTPAQKVGEARYLLTIGHLLSGDYAAAAAAGENLAKKFPTSRRAAAAAGYALEAYSNLAASDQTATDKLRDLAKYILSPESQQRWTGDPVLSVALYQLALAHRRDNNFKEMIALLEKIPPEFTGYIYAQGQLVFAALDAREKAGDLKEKKYFEDLARKTIAKLPPLPAEPDPSTATMYFYAQLEHAKFLYADGVADLNKGESTAASRKFFDMAKFVTQLQEQFTKLPIRLTDETNEKIRGYMSGMQKYAQLGVADLEYRAGNYDRIIGIVTKPPAGQKLGLLDELQKRTGKDGKIRMKDYQVTAELLGIALRAQVQKGKIDDAKNLLEMMKNLTGEEATLLADPTATLRALVGELEAQVKELKKGGNSVRLKTTVANFSAFLDELGKAFDKKSDAKDVLFLANCYDSISEHGKAAKLYAAIEAPMFLDKLLKPNEKFSEDEEQKLQVYWYAQVKLGEQLRLSSDIKEAKKIFDRAEGHPNKRMAILVEKEQLHLLEAMELWGTAATRWQKLQNNSALKAKAADDPALKKMYFDAYYHQTYCTYKYSQTPKGKAQEAAYVKTAANNILRLERAKNPANPQEPGEGWQIIGARFQELLAAEEPLRKMYEALKKQ